MSTSDLKTARHEQNDERHRAREERALRARSDIAVSNSEFVELLHSAISPRRNLPRRMSGAEVLCRDLQDRSSRNFSLRAGQPIVSNVFSRPLHSLTPWMMTRVSIWLQSIRHAMRPASLKRYETKSSASVEVRLGVIPGMSSFVIGDCAILPMVWAATAPRRLEGVSPHRDEHVLAR
jgi:hypothetical protein